MSVRGRDNYIFNSDEYYEKIYITHIFSKSFTFACYNLANDIQPK